MGNLKDLFVPYEIAKLAKEKGFNEECLAEYHDNGNTLFGHISNISSPFKNTFINKITDKSAVAAPMYQQIVEWLREKHKLNVISPTQLMYTDEWICRVVCLTSRNDKGIGGAVKEYCEAYNKAIKGALELI